MARTLTVLGLERLKKKLKALPPAVKVLIAAAMESSANDIVRQMKGLASRFTDSGDLQMSIGWTWGKAPKGALTVGTLQGSGDASDLLLTIYAGNAKAFYARWVEFGTATHVNGGEFPGTINPGAHAQPFFFVAYRANRKSARAKISRAINKAAKQVAQSGGNGS